MTDKKLDLYIGEVSLTITTIKGGQVVLVARPPAAAVPLEPDQARDIARRLRQAADKAELESRLERSKDRH